MKEELLSRLKHAIGMDNQDPKNGVYKAYRNGSIYYSEEPDWEELVSLGYAEKHVYGNEYIYSVNREGMQAVADETGILIHYTVECVPKELKQFCSTI